MGSWSSLVMLEGELLKRKLGGKTQSLSSSSFSCTSEWYDDENSREVCAINVEVIRSVNVTDEIRDAYVDGR